MPTTPCFNLEDLLKACLALEDVTSAHQNLFSSSPLSSLETTPHRSPLPSPQLKPSPLPPEQPTHSPQAVFVEIPVQEELTMVTESKMELTARKESAVRKARKKQQSQANRQGKRQEARAKNFATDTQEANVTK